MTEKRPNNLFELAKCLRTVALHDEGNIDNSDYDALVNEMRALLSRLKSSGQLEADEAFAECEKDGRTDTAVSATQTILQLTDNLLTRHRAQMLVDGNYNGDDPPSSSSIIRDNIDHDAAAFEASVLSSASASERDGASRLRIEICALTLYLYACDHALDWNIFPNTSISEKLTHVFLFRLFSYSDQDGHTAASSAKCQHNHKVLHYHLSLTCRYLLSIVEGQGRKHSSHSSRGKDGRLGVSMKPFPGDVPLEWLIYRIGSLLMMYYSKSGSHERASTSASQLFAVVLPSLRVRNERAMSVALFWLHMKVSAFNVLDSHLLETIANIRSRAGDGNFFELIHKLESQRLMNYGDAACRWYFLTISLTTTRIKGRREGGSDGVRNCSDEMALKAAQTVHKNKKRLAISSATFVPEAQDPSIDSDISDATLSYHEKLFGKVEKERALKAFPHLFQTAEERTLFWRYQVPTERQLKVLLRAHLIMCALHDGDHANHLVEALYTAHVLLELTEENMMIVHRAPCGLTSGKPDRALMRILTREIVYLMQQFGISLNLPSVEIIATVQDTALWKCVSCGKSFDVPFDGEKVQRQTRTPDGISQEELFVRLLQGRRFCSKTCLTKNCDIHRNVLIRDAHWMNFRS